MKLALVFCVLVCDGKLDFGWNKMWTIPRSPADIKKYMNAICVSCFSVLMTTGKQNHFPNDGKTCFYRVFLGSAKNRSFSVKSKKYWKRLYMRLSGCLAMKSAILCNKRDWKKLPKISKQNAQTSKNFQKNLDSPNHLSFFNSWKTGNFFLLITKLRNSFFWQKLSLLNPNSASI